MKEGFVHGSAVIDPGAELAEGVQVWHFSHVSEGAHIGAGTSLGQNVFVGRGVRVGARVKVQNNVSLYEGVEIADDVFLGPSCVFTNVSNPRAFIVKRGQFARTRVDEGATIGANATIVCGHDVGAYALIGAGATVTHDVPAHALMLGSPARRVAWVCVCGEKLPAAHAAQCASCGRRYRTDDQTCVLDTQRGEAMQEQPLRARSASKSRSIAPARPARGRHAASIAPDAGLTRDVPLLDLAAQNTPLAPELRAAFERVLASNQYILGPEVERFEAALCRELGFRHAITVSSGSDALLLALMALEVGPGDEVVTSTFSFFATAGCIARLGARPVFVDIDPVSFNIDPAQIELALSPRTKALLPVHLFGQVADLDALTAIAERRGIAIVEDAAQALGATRHGKQAGSAGTFGCFSFFPSKNLGGFGDGGLVVTEDDALAERARVLRSHGGKPKYHHALLGGNFRLDALQAALLGVKLPHLAGYAQARAENAHFYDQRFAALQSAGLITPRALQPGHVYNQYVVRTAQRDELRAALTRAGIGNEVYYPRCLHEQECFAELGYRPGDFPEAERAAREVIALPIYPELSGAQRERVAETVERFFQR